MSTFIDPFAARSTSPRERAPRGDRRVPGDLDVWVLIVGDMLIFGIMFVAFSYERYRQPEIFAAAHGTMILTYGVVNTLLLVTGSAVVACGVLEFREDRAGCGARLFGLGILCGLVFIVSKYCEWSDKLAAGNGPYTNSFAMFYFVLTGMHLAHLVAGLAVLVGMYRIARKPARSAVDLRNIEAGACLWHLIDLVWIVLFALLYLVS